MNLPVKHTYNKIVYFFEREIKHNMYLYRSETGIPICFDLWELFHENDSKKEDE